LWLNYWNLLGFRY